ncbi:drug resistance transporter, EmrB/QacA subfamily [Micromonospora echinospora]|uniref:Drug resistance transporter, EmrB/QacA subfamily n=1 Tax=Micromonospora echinospora TaxID=1877 RepID=A0A1C5A7Q6_MICEC|nr:MFS transporter [Micromonospora echinospora]SCF41283.1 drug resistance transporter, EmrB/QacA subfamily [Micromonospora echinospora]
MPAYANTGHPRRWPILGVTVVSLLLVVMDTTILNVALRTLADPVHGLGASQAELEWAINSYTLVFAGLLFSLGVLGDRYGRRRFLLAGLAVFGLGSLLSAYARDPVHLVLARAVMGLGGAAIMPATLSVIASVFDPRERPRAIGYWSASVGLAVAVGPVLGGILLTHFWWGSVFLVNVPVAFAGLVAGALLVPESRDPRPGRMDLPGVALSVVGLVALTWGVIDGGEHGFDRPVVWAAVLTGLAVLAVFGWHERRTDHPALDVRLFRVPRFAVPVVLVGLVFFAGAGVMFVSAFHLQLVRGHSPLHTGLLFLPLALTQLVLAPRSATLVRRHGARVVCGGGLGLVGVALAGWALVDATTPTWVVAVLLGVQGVGMAHITAPATESVLAALPREKAGVGSAVSNTVRQVGAALGVSVLGAVLAAVYRVRVAPATTALPDGLRETAEGSLAGAYGVAPRLGDAAALLATADRAFVAALHVVALIAAAVTGVGLLAVLRWMPGRPAVAPGPAYSEPGHLDPASPDPASPDPASPDPASPDPAGSGNPVAGVRTVET